VGEEKIPLEERLQGFFKADKYRSLISAAATRRERSVSVDFGDLVSFDEAFSLDLVNDPSRLLPLLDKAAYRQLQVEAPEHASSLEDFYARVTNLPIITSLREVRASNLGRLIMLDAIVVRASVVKPMLKKAVFKCAVCGAPIEVKQDTRIRIMKRPDRCPNPSCRARGKSFQLDEEASTFIDLQGIGLQEKPEDLPAGQLPRMLEIRLTEDLVDRARPGDRVYVTGILSSVQERMGEAALRTFRPYLEAVSLETASKEPEALTTTADEEKKFRQMASSPFIHRQIIESIAPSIYGLEDVKEAVMYLLLGGNTKEFPDGVRVRGDVNVLLVGDPGTAKSVLLQNVSKISPRGLYTSGRGSTAAGLTAAVMREKAGGMVLEAGAMVLADRGVCCIDEIDKMRPEDRVAIHEAMAQQTVSVAKGGIVATLNARTAVMAAANPSLGRYDSFRTFPENVNLPVTILSRFDLIFILKDVPDAEQDRKISDHILSLHSTGAPSISPPIPPDVLRKYVSYAKRIRPEMTPETMKVLENFFLATRAVYDQTSTVTITARQLESLIRLTEARARAALRETVAPEDAGAVVMLMKKSLSQVGVDVETGRPDIDAIMTGKPGSVREKLRAVIDVVKRLSEERGVAEEEAVKRDLLEQGLTDADIDRILRKLISEGTLYSPRPGAYKLT